MKRRILAGLAASVIAASVMAMPASAAVAPAGAGIAYTAIGMNTGINGMGNIANEMSSSHSTSSVDRLREAKKLLEEENSGNHNNFIESFNFVFRC